MDNKILEVAERIKGLRKMSDMEIAEMAALVDCSAEEYAEYESGTIDFTFTFLHKCAKIFGVDIVEILTGESPKLSFYSIGRSGEGLPIKRRKGFGYLHLAPTFKGKVSEPFVVKAPYDESEQDKPIKLSYHKGQEFNYILEGTLKIALENHIEILNEGDCVYYDSSHGHGMIATGGKDCKFIAIVMDAPEKKSK